MSKIQNFEKPVPAETLSTAELIVTMALILRGNYHSNKSYVSIKHSRDSNAAIKSLEEACSELNIPFKNIPSTKDKDYYYMWGTNLDLVLAKQQMLPHLLKWRTLLHIPETWIGNLSISKLKALEAITTQITRAKITRKGTCYLVPDALHLNIAIYNLFKPIAPNIETEFKYDKQCVYGLTHTSDTYTSELGHLDEDDFSDLL